MKAMIALAMTIAMLTVVGVGGANAAWVQKKRNVSPEERERMELQKSTSAEEIWKEGDYWQDFDKWMKVWKATKRGWDGTDPKDAYRQHEKRPIKSRMVILDPPLPKTMGPDVVEVEWFHTPIDSAGSGGIWGSAATRVVGWWTSWMKPDGDGKVAPVKLHFRMFGKGPTMLREFSRHRRVYQELVYAWGDIEFRTEGMKAFVALNERTLKAGGSLRGMNTRLGMESVIRSAAEMYPNYPRLNVDEWRALVDREETKARIREADERYLKMMTKAVKKNRRMRNGPHDPMLLIDGKYLLTGPITGRITDLFRMANWIIRKKVEEIPSYGFKPEEIQWGMERKPKKGELIKLRKPFPAGEGVEIEWLYTYITPDGQSKAVRWVWDTFWNWRDSLKEQGIEVTMSKAPIINGKGWVRKHQRVHQEAATSWKPSFWLRRNRIHITLADYLATNPDGIGNHDAAGKVLQARAQINQEIYDAARTGSTSDASELATLKTKGEMLERVRKRNRAARGPAFLINGEYVLMTKNLTDAFQSLNWAVRRLQEG